MGSFCVTHLLSPDRGRKRGLGKRKMIWSPESVLLVVSDGWLEKRVHVFCFCPHNSLYCNKMFYFSENVPLSRFLFIYLLIYNPPQATKDLR